MGNGESFKSLSPTTSPKLDAEVRYCYLNDMIKQVQNKNQVTQYVCVRLLLRMDENTLHRTQSDVTFSVFFHIFS